MVGLAAGWFRWRRCCSDEEKGVAAGRFRREGRTDRGEEEENAKALAGCVWVCEGKEKKRHITTSMVKLYDFELEVMVDLSSL